MESAIEVCKRCGGTDKYTNGRCKLCNRARVKQWQEEDPERYKQFLARRAATIKAKRAAEPEKWRPLYRKYSAKYRAENPERDREMRYKNLQAQKQRDPARFALIRRMIRRRNEGWAPGEHELAEARLPTVVHCDACGSTNPHDVRGWNADHDHSNGLFRGFLCKPCNIILGFCEKSAAQMSDQLAAYVARYKAARGLP